MATVEQSRTLAAEADAMTRQAADAAQRPTVMSNLAQSVDAWRGPARFPEIVAVVDGLALQTNILAL